MSRGGARAAAGIAASGHASVSQAASDVLAAGGNAFDAAIAAGFASAITEPALTSLGGGGFLLARDAEGRATLFDFFSDTPGREVASAHGDLEPHFVPVTVRFPGVEQVFNVGLGSVAVPGNLRGFLHVHERLGRIPLREVLAPAIALARDGVPLNDVQGYLLELLAPIMTSSEAGRAIFAPRGPLLGAGEPLANPDLASFLAALPESARDFYEGGLARRVAGDMREGGGLLGGADLASYRVVERAPLAVGYRGDRLLTNPPPAFGGSLLALSLELLAALDLSGTTAGSPAHACALLAVIEEVQRLREAGCLGPDALSAEERARVLPRLRRFSRGTTHVSIADGDGNAASMTSSNGEGSGYIVPGTGIMLNNMLGEDDLHPDGFHASPAGERVSSMMSPCLLLEGERVRLVIGSGGSKRIGSALLQVISLLSDYDLPLRQAIDHPRLHWDGNAVQVEPGLSAASLTALERLHPGRLNQWSRSDLYFGGVHAVVPGREGAGDPRRGGAARWC